MSKILLTGASGYIGGHLKDQLKIHHDIIATSKILVTKKMKRMLLGKSVIYLI